MVVRRGPAQVQTSQLERRQMWRHQTTQPARIHNRLLPLSPSPAQWMQRRSLEVRMERVKKGKLVGIGPKMKLRPERTHLPQLRRTTQEGTLGMQRRLHPVQMRMAWTMVALALKKARR